MDRRTMGGTCRPTPSPLLPAYRVRPGTTRATALQLVRIPRRTSPDGRIAGCLTSAPTYERICRRLAFQERKRLKSLKSLHWNSKNATNAKFVKVAIQPAH